MPMWPLSLRQAHHSLRNPLRGICQHGPLIYEIGRHDKGGGKGVVVKVPGEDHDTRGSYTKNCDGPMALHLSRGARAQGTCGRNEG